MSVRGHILLYEFQRSQWKYYVKVSGRIEVYRGCQRPQAGFNVSMKEKIRKVFESDQGKILCDCKGNSECIL